MNDFPLLTNIGAYSGKTYIAELDAVRLTGQALRVWNVMKDGVWRTLSEIQAATKGEHYDSEAAISARLRDFRKPRWGSHTVERRRRGMPEKGLFEYRLIVNR